VVSDASSGAGDDGGGLGCQASTTVTCCRFLLLLVTLKGRTSSICLIVIGSVQGSTTQDANRYSDQLLDSEGASQVIYLFRVILVLTPSSNDSNSWVDIIGRFLSKYI
jgi:hypothetical protein